MSLLHFESGRGLRYLAGAAVVAGAALLGAGTAAVAQQAPAGSAAAPATNPWFKLCNVNQETKVEQCLTSLEVRDDESAQLLVSVSVLINRNAPEGTRNVVLFGAPIGVYLPPGLEAQIDDQPAQKIEYTICSPNNCIAQVEATDAIIDRLKKGKELKIVVVNPRRQRISFPVTLGGFTKAFDGEPMSHEEYESRQQVLDAQIRKFVEERRKQIEEEQQKQQGGAAPAQQQ